MITELIYHHSVGLAKNGPLVRDNAKAADTVECKWTTINYTVRY